MTDSPSIDGISNVRVVPKYSDILGNDYRELHFDVQVSVDTDHRYDLVCRMADPPAERAERTDLSIEDGVATQHVMATYHLDPPSDVFFGWAPGEPITLSLFAVQDNYRDDVAFRDVTDAIETALADEPEPTEQEQIDALREALDAATERIDQLEDAVFGGED